MSEPIWSSITIQLPPVSHPAWGSWDEDDTPGVDLLQGIHSHFHCPSWAGERLEDCIRRAAPEGEGVDEHMTLGANDSFREALRLFLLKAEMLGQPVYYDASEDLNYGLNEICGELEELIELGIAFDAHDDPKYDWNGSNKEWRPGMSEVFEVTADGDGCSTVAVHTLLALLDSDGPDAVIAYVQKLAGPPALPFTYPIGVPA